MSDLQIIESALRAAARRRRLSLSLRCMWRWLLGGAIAGGVLLAAYKLFPLPPEVLMGVVWIPLACAAAGFIVGGWRRPGLNEMARFVDYREKLKERLSTALEVAAKPDAHRWSELVVSDAAEHARGLDARQMVPLKLSRAPSWALAVLMLVAGLGFVPEYRSKNYLQKEQDKANIQQVGRQLADLTRRNIARRPPVFEPTQRAMNAVSELGDRLSQVSLSRGEALKDIASVAEKLKNEANQLGQDPALKRLERAARAAGVPPGETAGAMQKQIEALQKQLGAPTGHPEALEKIKQALEKLQQTAMAQARNPGGAGEAERKQMAAALSSLSREMEDMGLQLPQLENAIEALAASQTETFLKDLKASVNDLEKMLQMAKSLQQMQQMAEKLGKDLTEQLERGQPEAAEQTLRKMAQQLESASLPADQIGKMLSEVLKAAPAAANYGQVAEHLKRAGEKMKSGQKSAASKDLAKAADELQKLMQQMGDAQAMLAELQALNQAAMVIADGKGWRPGRMPGAGKGGEPGGGVGTWAENEAMEWNGEFKDHWDNSGVVREDLDPRGISDRGEGTLNDALKPTKVRGQFSPGSQMPSITLKGVSIKGQSAVEYEASAAAAQSDAQSALSQEKVPRAYQGAVKEYFDDLK